MKALIVEPNKKPYMIEIDNALKDLQNAVGGMIQVIYPWHDPVAIICNEEGKIDGLPLNRILYDEYNHPYDLIAGSFLIVGIDEENSDFKDIPNWLAPKYMELFTNPALNFNDINLLFGTKGTFPF